MSVPPGSVVPIFATPFGVFPLPEAAALNPALERIIGARARAAGGANPLTYCGPDDLFDATEPELTALGASILGAVRSMAAAVNDLPAAQLQSFTLQARGRCTIVRPDGNLPATSHPLTAWCAVYCVAAPPPSAQRRDSGVLRLYESRLGTMFSDATNSVMRVPYSLGHYGWWPVPGHVAVFPGSITHEVALNRSRSELVLVTARARFVAPGQQGWSSW